MNELRRNPLYPSSKATVPAAPAAFRRDYRRAAGQRQIPWGFNVMALALLVLVLVNALIPGPNFMVSPFTYVIAALILLIASFAISRTPVQAAEYLFTLAMFSVLGVLRVSQALEPNATKELFFYILAVAFGAITFWLRPLALSLLLLVLMEIALIQPAWGLPPMTNFTLVLNTSLMFLVGGLAYIRLQSGNREADALAQITALSRIDPLTGLLNRHGMQQDVARASTIAQRQGLNTVVSYIDIDGLKGVNDSHGHQSGDRIIQLMGDCLQSAGREDDIIARVGGDEFVVVSVGQATDHGALLERVQDCVNKRNDPEVWSGWISSGTASGAASDVQVDALMAQADDDLYRQRHMRGYH